MNIKRNWIQTYRIDICTTHTIYCLLCCVVLNRIQFVSHRKKDGFYLDCLQTIAMLSCSLRCVRVSECLCIQCSPNWISTSVFSWTLNLYAFRLPLSVYPVWFQCRLDIHNVYKHWARKLLLLILISYQIWHWPWNVLPVLMQRFHLNMQAK